jgi:hypothetical protein
MGSPHSMAALTESWPHLLFLVLFLLEWATMRREWYRFQPSVQRTNTLKRLRSSATYIFELTHECFLICIPNVRSCISFLIQAQIILNSFFAAIFIADFARVPSNGVEVLHLKTSTLLHTHCAKSQCLCCRTRSLSPENHYVRNT